MTLTLGDLDLHSILAFNANFSAIQTYTKYVKSIVFTARKLREGNVSTLVYHSVHRGSLSRGVSVRGVSVQGGLCQGDPRTVNVRAVRILLECILVRFLTLILIQRPWYSNLTGLHIVKIHVYTQNYVSSSDN